MPQFDGIPTGKYERKRNIYKTHVVKYYFVITLCNISAIILQINILRIYFIQPELFRLVDIVGTCMFFVCLVTYLSFQILLTFHSTTFILAVNLVGDIEDNEWFYQQVVLKHSKKLFKRVIDPAAVITILLICGVTSILLIVAVYLVYNDSDIIHLSMYAWNLADRASTFPSKCFRFLITVYSLIVISMVQRYIFMFFFYAGAVSCRIIHWMLKVKPQFVWNCISLYKQGITVGNQFLPVVVTANSVGFSVAFALLVGLANIVIWGFILNWNFAKVFGTIYFNFITFIVKIMFSITCRPFEESDMLVRNWTNLAMRKREGGYMKRVLKSMKLLAVPAGSCGICEKEFKMNFFSQVAAYIINVHLAMKEIWIPKLI